MATSIELVSFCKTLPIPIPQSKLSRKDSGALFDIPPFLKDGFQIEQLNSSPYLSYFQNIHGENNIHTPVLTKNEVDEKIQTFLIYTLKSQLVPLPENHGLHRIQSCTF